MARAKKAFLLLVVLVAVVQARDSSEATCPPARFIECGPEPAPKTCLSYVVSQVTGARQCCWVVDGDGAPMPDVWKTAFVSNALSVLLFTSQQFGALDGAPVMEAEFELGTRVMTRLSCHYYFTDKCAPGAGTEGVAVTLQPADPTRFRVTDAVARHTARETEPDPGEYVCQCDHKDVLPLPERYRCCYWDSGIPVDAAGSTALRTTSCTVPRARADPDTSDCRRIVRPVAACGDAGACYCRFEYNTLAPGITRDPWGCGQCCPVLTNDFGRDQLAKNNNTRHQCLTDVYPFTPATDGACGEERLGRRLPEPATSGAARRSAFWW